MNLRIECIPGSLACLSTAGLRLDPGGTITKGKSLMSNKSALMAQAKQRRCASLQHSYVLMPGGQKWLDLMSLKMQMRFERVSAWPGSMLPSMRTSPGSKTWKCGGGSITYRAKLRE